MGTYNWVVRRNARKAASLHTAARSAPTYPVHISAISCSYHQKNIKMKIKKQNTNKIKTKPKRSRDIYKIWRLMSWCKGNFLLCTWRIWRREERLGTLISISLSKRPGLRIAGSNTVCKQKKKRERERVRCLLRISRCTTTISLIFPLLLQLPPPSLYPLTPFLTPANSTTLTMRTIGRGDDYDAASLLDAIHQRQ